MHSTSSSPNKWRSLPPWWEEILGQTTFPCSSTASNLFRNSNRTLKVALSFQMEMASRFICKTQPAKVIGKSIVTKTMTFLMKVTNILKTMTNSTAKETQCLPSKKRFSLLIRSLHSSTKKPNLKKPKISRVPRDQKATVPKRKENLNRKRPKNKLYVPFALIC